MLLLVRSAFDDKELEVAIQKAVETAKTDGYYLDEVKYSTCYDHLHQKVLRSALLLFEDDDDDFEEDDEW